MWFENLWNLNQIQTYFYIIYSNPSARMYFCESIECCFVCYYTNISKKLTKLMSSTPDDVTKLNSSCDWPKSISNRLLKIGFSSVLVSSWQKNLLQIHNPLDTIIFLCGMRLSKTYQLKLHTTISNHTTCMKHAVHVWLAEYCVAFWTDNVIPIWNII